MSAITTIDIYLEFEGREFPKPDDKGMINGQQFEDAWLPMVVACASCMMTFVLTGDRLVGCEYGEVYCSKSCAGVD